MKNRRGETLKDRLDADIEYAVKVGKAGKGDILAVRALGAVDIAVEFGLITYKEWKAYIERIFEII